VLTVEAVGPTQHDGGDRRDGSVLGEEQSNDEIGARKKMSGGAGWLGELGGGEERSLGSFYRRAMVSCANAPPTAFNGGAVAERQLPSVACGAVVLKRRRAGGVMARQRRQAGKGRVGQALWRAAAVAAAGTALARRAARRGDGTIRQLGGSGLALRGWRGAACCIACEARERILAFAWLASRVLWLCCCCGWPVRVQLACASTRTWRGRREQMAYGEEKEINLIRKCNKKGNWMEIRCMVKIRWQRSLSSKDKFLQ